MVAEFDDDRELASERWSVSITWSWTGLLFGAVEWWRARLVSGVLAWWRTGLVSEAIEWWTEIRVWFIGAKSWSEVDECGVSVLGDQGAGQEGDEAIAEQVEGEEEQVFTEKIEAGDQEVVVGIKGAQHEHVSDNVALCGRVGQIGMDVQGFGREKKG